MNRIPDNRCPKCNTEWDNGDFPSQPANICPNCGADTRNPIPYFYPNGETEDIKNNFRDKEWLKNVNLKNFIIEKENRENEVQMFERQLEFDYLLMGYGFEPDTEIVKYCEERFNNYDLSVFNVDCNGLAKEIDLIQPLPPDERDLLVIHTISAGLKDIAQHRLDELYEAMELRKDKKLTSPEYLNELEKDEMIEDFISKMSSDNSLYRKILDKYSNNLSKIFSIEPKYEDIYVDYTIVLDSVMEKYSIKTVIEELCLNNENFFYIIFKIMRGLEEKDALR